MKRFLTGAAFFLCLSIPACQCSDKPEVGPIENASVVSPSPDAVGMAAVRPA